MVKATSEAAGWNSAFAAKAHARNESACML
jgi:hypothetical protein